MIHGQLSDVVLARGLGRLLGLRGRLGPRHFLCLLHLLAVRPNGLEQVAHAVEARLPHRTVRVQQQRRHRREDLGRDQHRLVESLQGGREGVIEST
jgi:hypothetical protein